MISKLECLCLAQIAILRIIQRNEEIDPYNLYREMKYLLNI